MRYPHGVGFPSLLVHVRHAEPQFILGVPDRELPLSQRGYNDSCGLGVLMRERFGKFDVIIHSGFLRTRQTAECIAKAFKARVREPLPFLHSSLMNERDSGACFGLTAREVASKFPDFERHRNEVGEIHVRYPDGERFSDVCDRVDRFMEIELPAWTGKKVCVVGHWGTYFAFRRYFECLSDDEILRDMGLEHPRYGSLLVMTPDGSSMAVREKNLLLFEPPQAAASGARPD